MLTTLSSPATKSAERWRWTPAALFLLAGAIAFIVPTMLDVARESWSTEQGAHGPLVLATGLWRVLRERPRIAAVARPGSMLLGFGLLVPLAILFALARITSIIEIESIVMYLCLVTVFYILCGGAAVRAIWFPLVYLLFVFPPPDTLFAALTQPLKIAISEWSVDLLYLMGYPVAGSGVTIQIGQYEMLVAAACAGLNSLISLTALGLFYTYLRHSSNWRFMLLLVCCIIPIAVLANLVRVLMLLLITYHFGEAAGQGFFHELAGMTMFVTALLGIFLIDWIFTPLRQRWAPAGYDA